MRGARNRIPLRERRTYGASRAVRHPDCDYTGEIDIHLTICADRGTPFQDATIAAMVCENVEFYCRKLGYRLYGHCLMPDHLHVVLSPTSSGAPLRRWLREFKSFTTNAHTEATGQPALWQRSAHDRICRTGETAEKVLTYIVNNPVRAGLAECWKDWPWTRVFIEL